ncbi:MAG: hypothetical protein GQ532_00645 [Methylomarinum sp.]|nr:hypothetical protein [Methylomarinum sp.]
MLTLEQITQVFKLAPRYLVAVIVFCSVLLFIKDDAAKILGVFNFAQNYRQWLGVSLIATSSLVAIDWSIKISRVVRNRMFRVKKEKSILQSLHSLTEEEKQILRYYFAKQSKSNVLRIDDGIINGLVAKDVIFRAASQGNLVEGFAHNINELVWDYLDVNLGLLNGETNVYRTDKRKNLF